MPYTKTALFYEDLVKFMTRNPVMIQVLEGENAVAKNRELMGATNPADAAPGTIRADFAESVSVNAVHGSDSVENAAIENCLLLQPKRNLPHAKNKSL